MIYGSNDYGGKTEIYSFNTKTNELTSEFFDRVLGY